jgi:uncharacterized protein YqgC (DUF456 family)
METAVLIFALLLMFIGLILSVVPLFPGIPIIFVAILIYGIGEGFQKISLWFLLLVLGITIFSFFIDNIAGWVGAKKFGASRAGVWGAIIGGLVGPFFYPLVGILFGPFVGAVVSEVVFSQRKISEAVKVGVGTLFGLMGGGFLRLLLGILIIVAFFMQLW